MPKKYFCKFEGCGEIDPENFENGRYSTCKKCRIKGITEKIYQRKHLELIDKIRKIDPEEEIQMVVDYSLKNKEFNDGFSVLENIVKITEDHKKIVEEINTSKINKDKLFQNFDELKSNYEQVRIVFNAMKNRIEDLEFDLLQFKNKIDLEFIYERLKSLENYRRDCLNEKIMNQNNS